MDVLSDVLRAIRLTGAVYFDVQAHAPWVAETPPVSSICAEVMPDFEHVIAFHIVLEGCCWAQMTDDTASAVRMEAGDAVIFVDGDAHVMSAERGQRATPDLNLYRGLKNRPLPFVFSEFGGDGDRTHLVCGYLGCDARPFNPILDALPRMLLVHANEEGINLTLNLIRAALQESERPRAGGETILSKLSELMFLQALRQHIDGLPPEATGLAFRTARPPRRDGAAPDARPSGRALDDRCAGARSRIVALGIRRALHRADGRAVDALSRQLAAPTGGANAGAPRHQRRAGGPRSGLRVGGRVQPRVQEAGRRAAGVVAARTDG